MKLYTGLLKLFYQRNPSCGAVSNGKCRLKKRFTHGSYGDIISIKAIRDTIRDNDPSFGGEYASDSRTQSNPSIT
jgi:hypothetical protein